MSAGNFPMSMWQSLISMDIRPIQTAALRMKQPTDLNMIMRCQAIYPTVRAMSIQDPMQGHRMIRQRVKAILMLLRLFPFRHSSEMTFRLFKWRKVEVPIMMPALAMHICLQRQRRLRMTLTMMKEISLSSLCRTALRISSISL